MTSECRGFHLWVTNVRLQRKGPDFHHPWGKMSCFQMPVGGGPQSLVTFENHVQSAPRTRPKLDWLRNSQMGPAPLPMVICIGSASKHAAVFYRAPSQIANDLNTTPVVDTGRGAQDNIGPAQRRGSRHPKMPTVV